jgi:hypothetical protein
MFLADVAPDSGDLQNLIPSMEQRLIFARLFNLETNVPWEILCWEPLAAAVCRVFYHRRTRCTSALSPDSGPAVASCSYDRVACTAPARRPFMSANRRCNSSWCPTLTHCVARPCGGAESPQLFARDLIPWFTLPQQVHTEDALEATGASPAL